MPLAGSSSRGKRAASRCKRAATDSSDTEAAKKYKTAIDAAADEWICPITTELPLVPVVAEDGHTYERSAIEQLIAAQGANLKSPMTNVAMGKKLLPCSQARNTIEKLVRSGAVTDDKAGRWLERLNQEERVKEMEQSAERGDANAMRVLGAWLLHGAMGLAPDDATAFSWFERCAHLDDAAGLAMASECLLAGRGAAKDPAQGIGMAFQAAALGSKRAASDICDWHYFGMHGLREDHARALHWCRKIGTNTVYDLDDGLALAYVERLRELEQRMPP